MSNITTIAVIVGMNKLLETFADYLCDCRGKNNRPADIQEHTDECEYRKIAQGERL